MANLELKSFVLSWVVKSSSINEDVVSLQLHGSFGFSDLREKIISIQKLMVYIFNLIKEVSYLLFDLMYFL